jgi:hypothetical protein
MLQAQELKLRRYASSSAALNIKSESKWSLRKFLRGAAQKH